MKNFLLIAALAASLQTTRANWFTQMFESDSDRIIREFRERQAQERADQEWTAFINREQAIRLSAARYYYGDGNPDHLAALADQLDPAYLNAYRDVINNRVK